MHMSKLNIASFSKEEQDKISVDKAAAAVAWQERLNKPVVPEIVEREQPVHLRQYFRERPEVHRQNSQQLPRANAPEYKNPEMSSRSNSWSQCVQGGESVRMSLMFPTGITPDNCQPSLKPHVIHSYPLIFLFSARSRFHYGRLP